MTELSGDAVVGAVACGPHTEPIMPGGSIKLSDLAPEIQALIRAGQMVPRMVKALVDIARSPTRETGGYYTNKDKQQWAYECLRDIGHPYGRGRPEALAAYQAAIGGDE